MDEMQRRQRALEDEYFAKQECAKLTKLSGDESGEQSLSASSELDRPRALIDLKGNTPEDLLRELISRLGDPEFRQYLGETFDLYPYDGNIGLVLRVNGFLEEPSKALKLVVALRHPSLLGGRMVSSTITFFQHEELAPRFLPPSFSEGSLWYKASFCCFCGIVLVFGWLLLVLSTLLKLRDVRVRRFFIRYLQAHQPQRSVFATYLHWAAGLRNKLVVPLVVVASVAYLVHPPVGVVVGLPPNTVVLAMLLLELTFLLSLQEKLPKSVAVIGMEHGL